MFTWECPKCGREIDIAESECPNCNPKKKPSPVTVAAASPQVASQPYTPQQPYTPPAQYATPAAAPPPPQIPPPIRRKPASASWGLQGKHVAIFLLVAIAAIGIAVYLARPDLFRRAAQLEDVPASAGTGDSGAAYVGDIEVAGVRTFYTPDYKPKASVVVVNHGESAQWVNLRVTLRTREAAMSDTPLATFEIRLDKQIDPGQIVEYTADVTAMGALASLPPWRQMRVDLQPL